MALCWVKVVRSDGGGISDSVYVDGNYADIAGAIGTPFRTETGQNTFETLDAGLARHLAEDPGDQEAAGQ